MPWEDAEGTDRWQGWRDAMPPDAEHVQQRCVRERSVVVTYRVGLFGYSLWILCEVARRSDASQRRYP